MPTLFQPMIDVGNSAVDGTKLKKGNKSIIAKMADRTKFFSLVLIHKLNIIIIQRIVLVFIKDFDI